MRYVCGAPVSTSSQVVDVWTQLKPKPPQTKKAAAKIKKNLNCCCANFFRVFTPANISQRK